MASQNYNSSSLPDTQNADALTLTQSQEVSSQQQTLTVWGRLIPIRTSFKTLEMIRDSYSVGRSESCDICMTSQEMKLKWLNAISKVHFRIYKEHIGNTNETVVFLEDMSQNGTFVEKTKVGRGKRVIIGSNSEIALANEKFSVYIFTSTIMPDAGDLPPQLKEKYVLGRKLGSGAGGEVRLIFTKDGSKRFAMKIIKKDSFSSNKHAFNDPEKIKNEVQILKKLRHPCIIQTEEIIDTKEAVYIILELMEGGELFTRIKIKGGLSEPCAKLIFYQIVLAVHYLHKEGITHRDLKPENILLATNSDITLAKVSDFGLSKLVDTNTMKTFCGTPMYVAPEILARLGRSSYTNQVDVWSLGVILYICLSGIVPFNTQKKGWDQSIRQGAYTFPPSHFGHISQDAITLIKCMMTVNPKKRLTVPQILLHPWLRDPIMRESVHQLISENNENAPPANILRDQRENLLPEVKRARLNA